MTTFLHRGLLNPPSGVEDGLSLGTISRAVEDVDYSLLYSLVWGTGSVTEGDTNDLSTFATVGGATQTGLTMTVLVGPMDPDGPLEDSPTPTVLNANGWTLSTTQTIEYLGVDYYEMVFTKASLGTGSNDGPVIRVDTMEPGTAYVWLNGTNGSDQVPTASQSGNGSSFTILAAPVFDALVTTPTHLSTHDLDVSTPSNTPLPCTVTATASGQNQTNGYVKVDVYDSYGAGGLIDSISTTDAAGFTQTSAWALDGMTGIWSAVFEKSTVDIGSDEIDFTIEFAGNTGQIFIRTNGTAPQTSQDAGSGNEVEVDINELASASPPTYQAQGTVAQANSASNLVVSWPTHEANDIGILCVVGLRGANAFAAPSGWTEIPDSPSVDTGNGLYARLHVFWKRAASAAEGDATITDIAGDDFKIGQIITFRGCETSGNPFDVTAASNTGGTASTSVSVPGDTTTVNQCLVVAICGHSQIDSTSAQFSSWANGDLTDVQERVDHCTNASIGYGLGVATGVKATAGAFGATTATLGSSATQGRISIALKPPA